MRNWITILTAAVLLSAWSLPFNHEITLNPVVKEIPVMRVNVYMMGRQEVSPEVTIKISENIDYLNEAYAGYISFEFDELFMDPNHAYLPDLYRSFHEGNPGMVRPIVKPIEKKGGINVYLFDTYCEEGQTAALMGFTPLLTALQNTYARNSPTYDRIMMAYEGLEENKTLVHEMGHFFGLKHPWELTVGNKYSLGIRNAHDEAKNHMSYGNEVEKFTPQQLENMRQYALRYRSYLMERIVKIYAKA